MYRIYTTNAYTYICTYMQRDLWAIIEQSDIFPCVHMCRHIHKTYIHTVHAHIWKKLTSEQIDIFSMCALYMYIHIYMYVCICITYTLLMHIRTYAHICTFVRTCAHTCRETHLRTKRYCFHVCIVYVYIYIYIYMYMYSIYTTNVYVSHKHY
jgi:hypothetical protein